MPESTPQRLLKNAERLMAEKGIAATSVREITDASNANVASVNYYFGSKSELLLELLKNRFTQLDAELLARVSDVETKTNGHVPDIRELTGAYFDALAHLGFDGETGQLDPFILLIQRASAEQEVVLERAQDYHAPGITKMVSLLAYSVPEERRKSLEIPVLMGLMFTASVTAMIAMNPEHKNEILFSAVREFLVAGIEAYMRRFADAS
ncbi:TetR/AcrR family transcriptional regulator [Roseibium sp. SCP14]|uniref:TetR/AcrR family transcriptional regulator n=1 Tax=Roseibium sp. SCP14 TaxID=3141375 RepID=UPI0033369C21